MALRADILSYAFCFILLQMEEYLQGLRASDSGASIEVIGRSVEGEKLYVAKVCSVPSRVLITFVFRSARVVTRVLRSG